MIHTFETVTELEAPVSEVFQFFSVAQNLNLLTPKNLHFEILTPMPIEMRLGTIIDYRLRLRGVPMSWRTEITEWVQDKQFTDSQVHGPYKRWIHTHTFEAIEGGTRMHDRVEYELPFGWLGGIAHPLVRKDIARIFAFRGRAIAESFALASQ